MQVTPNERTIIEFTFTVTEADARAALEDPFSFGEQIAEQLRPHVGGNGNGNGHKPKAASQLKLGRNGHKRAAPKGGKARVGVRVKKHPCHACTKSFTSPAYLARHVGKAHGSTSDSRADSVGAAA